MLVDLKSMEKTRRGFHWISTLVVYELALQLLNFVRVVSVTPNRLASNT